MQDFNPKIDFFFFLSSIRVEYMWVTFRSFSGFARSGLFFNLMCPLYADHLNLHELTEAKQRG